MSVESAAVSFMRQIWMGVSKGDTHLVNGTLPMDVATYIQNRKRKELAELEDRYGVTVSLNGDYALPPGGGKLDFIKEEKKG